MSLQSFRLRPRVIAMLLSCGLLAAGKNADALNPKSPEVQALVAKGVKLLETSTDARLGARALQGLTLLKADVEHDHPVVQRALAAVQQGQKDLAGHDVYTLGLCTIFLVELDPKAYRAEVQAYLDHLLSIQKPHGGWGYPNQNTGDTSMTQYGVLAMWETEQVGFKPSVAAFDKVANWLLRTQDPTGAWGYQGVDAGSFALVQQQGVRPSMASAGLGSLYICADHYHFRRRSGSRDGSESNVPSALVQVRKGSAPQTPQAPCAAASNVDLNVLGQALARGDKWMGENYTINPPMYPHYFLYAFERYQSFRELSSNPPFSPATWYDEGVYHLSKTQSPTGAWSSSDGDVPDTCFAMLFLLRSSRKSIERKLALGPGTLVSGRGLPDGSDVELRMGQVKKKPLAGPAEQLLAAIEDPGHPDYLRAVEGLEEKMDRASTADFGRLGDRLRRLANSDAPEARAAALRALARTRNLDNVPILLAALQDPNDEVFLAAEQALQFMSRTIVDPNENEGVTPNRRANTVRKWKAWYLSIRPQAKLDD